MLKTKRKRYVLVFGASLLLFGFVMCCSGIQFPFFSAKSDLNRHLKDDFGISLPPSAVVNKAYWVALRDPENVYALDLNPAEVTPFVDALRAAATKDEFHEEQDNPPAQTHPLYRAPDWWNNPPLTDASTFNVQIKNAHGGIIAHDGFLYSTATGKMYIVWGEF